MISVIIVNYRVKEKILKCLNSIYLFATNISLEVIVVDNDEKDVLSKDLNLKFSKVKYINSKKNVGFGAANNLGANQAKGKYLFFLNPDTLIQKDTTEQLYKFIEKNRNTGIVSPLLVDENQRSFDSQSRKELTPLTSILSFSFLRKIFPRKSIYNDDFFKNWDKRTPIEVDAVPGAAFMISKDLFYKIGGFDEKFFLYFEENDISKRVRSLGYKIFVIPDLTITKLWSTYN